MPDSELDEWSQFLSGSADEPKAAHLSWAEVAHTFNPRTQGPEAGVQG